LSSAGGGGQATGSQCNGWKNEDPRPLDIWLLNKQKQRHGERERMKGKGKKEVEVEVAR